MAILRDRPQGFRVLSGDDAVTLPLVALGADGIVSVVSNEVPDLMARLSELALQGKWDEARALHYRLLPLMEANFIESNPGPVKAAMALQGPLADLSVDGTFRFFDKDTYPVRPTTLADRVRIVPGGSTIRDGCYVAPGVVCMPPMYVNVGAYVDEGTMIDSHALVGSCAQIG